MVQMRLQGHRWLALRFGYSLKEGTVEELDSRAIVYYGGIFV